MNPKPKILILEDNPKIAQELALMVNELGYEVSNQVKSYEEALASFKNNPPDLVLCDIKIHGYRDGIQTATDMLKIKSFPIIYLTAFFEDEIADRALATEPAGYLIKPVSFQQLEIALKMALKPTKYIHQLPSLGRENGIFICTKGVYEHILLDDILYLEADNVGTKLITTNNIYEVASKTLKKMLEELDYPSIIRVSRSEAIHLKKIKQFDKALTYIILDKENINPKLKIKNIVYITDSYREEMRKALGL